MTTIIASSATSEKKESKVVKAFFSVLSAVLCLGIFMPVEWLWFQFIPSKPLFDKWPMTFHFGVFCGIGVTIFAPLSIFLTWSSLRSIERAFRALFKS
jgi:hypothetical protein